MLKYCFAILLLFSGVLLAQNPACLPSITIAVSQNNICMGTPVTFQATITNEGTGGAYQWKKNNGNAGIADTASYTAADFKNGDVVFCEYHCQTACGKDTTVVSNAITMQVKNDFLPSITIANNDSLICEGEITTFTAQASYGNAIPSYLWTVNGKPVGDNSPAYTTNTLTNGSKIECVLSISTPSCPGTKSSNSQMTIYVYPMIHPTINITPSRTQICRGEEVTFTATANGGAYPSFAWEVNGKPTGDVGPALITSTLKDGDSVSCIITIDQDSRCHTTTSAPSNKVGIQVQDFVDPTVTIAAPLLDVCSGTAVTFTATDQNAGSDKAYHWQVNGKDVGPNSPTYISDQFQNGDQVSCLLTASIPGCSIIATALSDTEIVMVKEAPQIIFPSPQIEVLSGEPVQLQATVSGNFVSASWTPEAAVASPHSLTTATVPLIQDTTFLLMVMNADGCKASKELTVKVLHRFYLPNAFTPNGDGRNDVFGIPPGSSFSLQGFSVYDRWGKVVYKTTDSSQSWDGTYKGQKADTGIYVYLIKGMLQNKAVLVKGTVTLIR